MTGPLPGLPAAGTRPSGPAQAVSTLGLTKRYGHRTAVDRLDLVVAREEVFGFLGPNSAGKTTTLRMLVGLVRPTGGTAMVLGVPAGPPAGLARIGALIEAPAFHPYLSGRDNLRVLARRARVSERAVDTALDQVEGHRASMGAGIATSGAYLVPAVLCSALAARRVPAAIELGSPDSAPCRRARRPEGRSAS